jgi:hypothetical protein
MITNLKNFSILVSHIIINAQISNIIKTNTIILFVNKGKGKIEWYLVK